MSKISAPPADEGQVTIAEMLADPDGLFKGAPNTGVIAGPNYAPSYKAALNQSPGVGNSIGSEGPDQSNL